MKKQYAGYRLQMILSKDKPNDRSMMNTDPHNNGGLNRPVNTYGISMISCSTSQNGKNGVIRQGMERQTKDAINNALRAFTRRTLPGRRPVFI